MLSSWAGNLSVKSKSQVVSLANGMWSRWKRAMTPARQRLVSGRETISRLTLRACLLTNYVMWPCQSRLFQTKGCRQRQQQRKVERKNATTFAGTHTFMNSSRRPPSNMPKMRGPSWWSPIFEETNTSFIVVHASSWFSPYNLSKTASGSLDSSSTLTSHL